MRVEKPFVIYIVQLLCPQRHCIVGLAFKDDELTFEAAKKVLKAELVELKVNPWCGICGSYDPLSCRPVVTG
jgi:hypothetical protein